MDCMRRDPVFAAVLAGSVGDTQTSEIKLLRQLGVPTLIMHGAEERLIKHEFLDGLAAELPNAYKGAVQVIDGAGHTPQFERPEEFNRIMKEFADSVF